MVYQVLQRLLLPTACVLCAGSGQPDLDICENCAVELPTNDRCCAICAEPLPTNTDGSCGGCLRRRPRYRSTHCAFRYDYPIDHLIRAYKYHARIAHSRVLGELLARSLQATRCLPWPEILLPVPLGAKRFRERGFNQAIEIAKSVARRLDIPLRTDALVRIRETGEQAGLERKARRRNVRNAFSVRDGLRADHVAIVDDVITTGSTANEIARVLRRAGIDHVEVWAVARATR